MPKWCYFNAGIIHGPCSIDELKQRVVDGKLQESDVVWPEGENPSQGVYASTVLRSSGLISTGVAPDWLQDVAKLETKGPIPPPAPVPNIPDWVEDLRHEADLQPKQCVPPETKVEPAEAPSPSHDYVPLTAGYLDEEEAAEQPPPRTARAILLGALTALPFLTFATCYTAWKIWRAWNQH